MTTSPTTNILSTSLAVASYPEAIAALIGLIEEEAPASPPAPSIILANVHVVTEAALNAEFQFAVDDATLVFPDGMPLVWAIRMLGHPITDRCYGPEFMARVIDVSQQTDWSHFLYGATETTLNRLEETIRKKWPCANIVGHIAPPFGPLDDAVEMRNIQRINDAGPTIVWIGLGCPKQEYWMQRYRRHLNNCVVIASGQAFDTIAGIKPSAPDWMQRHGLEWLFRLASEPRRLWKRYLLRNPYFVIQFVLQRAGLRWQEKQQ